jgi:hypothetical protein
VASAAVRTGLLAFIVAGLALLGWGLVRYLRAQGPCFVYSHDGEQVFLPAILVKLPDGRPPFVHLNLGLFRIPADVADSGGEILATGPGCGLLRRTVRRESRITLPPPIRFDVAVAGSHALPSGEYGLGLRFEAVGVDPQTASVLGRGPVAADYWQRPRRSGFGDSEIWIDPSSRAAPVLLPCAGRWRIVWSHVDRPTRSIGLVYGTGETEVSIAGDGERCTLTIGPEELENPFR